MKPVADEAGTRIIGDISRVSSALSRIGQAQAIYFVKEITKDVHQGRIELGTGLIGDETPRTLDIPSLFVGSRHSYGVIHIAYRHNPCR